MPPSTTISAPVMYELSSDARKSAAFATSCGRPSRPRSVFPNIALLDGPIRFTPIVEERRRGYFEGAIVFDRMLAGVVDFPPNLASPTGTALAL